jgi:hypothetical protein
MTGWGGGGKKKGWKKNGNKYTKVHRNTYNAAVVVVVYGVVAPRTAAAGALTYSSLGNDTSALRDRATSLVGFCYLFFLRFKFLSDSLPSSGPKI